MKKYRAGTLTGLLLVVALCVVALPVFAHDLEYDGNIGALLHINPNDTATPEQPATLVFHFLDKLKQFTPAQCDCSVMVSDSAGKNIFSATLDADDPHYGDDTRFTIVTFPHVGVYTVVLSGAPLAASAVTFAPFHISYDVRVENGTGAPRSYSHMHDGSFWSIHSLHIVLFGLAFGLAIGVVIRDKRREKRYTDSQ